MSSANPYESITVPNGWSCKRLVECTRDGSISYGIVQPGQHTEDGVPVIRINNINNGQLELIDVLKVSHEIEKKYERTRLNGGEVLLTLVGSTGQSFVAPKELAGWNVPRAIAVIRADETIGADWINICLQTEDVKHFLNVRANTTVQKTLNLKDVRDIPILIPPKDVKTSIEGIAMGLAQKIHLNTQTNQTLEAIAQAIFKSWFVDFDPVKAKMAVLAEGGSREQAELAAMCAISGKSATELAHLQHQNPAHYQQLAKTAALFPSAMVDAAQGSANAASAGSAGAASELGEIPEGWEIKSLDEIAHYQNGLALQNFRPEGDEYLPVLKIAQLKKGFADGEEKASPTIKPECIVENGDVVFSWSGSLMVDVWCGGKAALNQHLFKVTSRHYPKWVYYFCTKHHLSDFQRIASDKAVTMGHIKREHLSDAKCALPPLNALSQFSRFIDPLLERQVCSRLETFKLSKLRDSLLPKLLSGEIDLTTIQSEVA